MLLSFIFIFFLLELIGENRPIGRPPILQNEGRCWRCSKNIHRHSTLGAPPFFTRGQNAHKIWPKFRPQSSLDRRIFERRRFIGKQKQICQGPMIDLPPYQTRSRWGPLTLRTVGAMGSQKGKSGKFLIYPPFQRPTPSRRPPVLHQ